MSRLRKKELTSSSYMSHCESTNRPPKKVNPRHTALESNVCDFFVWGPQKILSNQITSICSSNPTLGQGTGQIRSAVGFIGVNATCLRMVASVR
jgi:hypothetical protein